MSVKGVAIVKRRWASTGKEQSNPEEVEKLVDAGMMKEVHYHNWLSNPIMVKKHDGSWRMCVDFKDLNKACPQDGYPLPEIDWKIAQGTCKSEWETSKFKQVFVKSAEKSLPFFKTLKKCTKKNDFQWTQEAEAAFKQMKKLIAELSMLTAPKEKEELIIYLAAAKEAISTVLLTRKGGKQISTDFVSRALRGSEIKYNPMEKLVLALLSASRRLKRYFQAHAIIVITDQPIKQLLPRASIKGQILADFIVERPEEESPDEPMTEQEEIPKP
ncbi:reverse transcriptase domain-containing protein [Tanacetum coccineum]